MSENQSVESRIEQVIDERIRPGLQMDGGDIEFLGFEEGVVKVRLVGACHSCPSATMTLTFGVERMLKEEIAEVEAIENIMF